MSPAVSGSLTMRQLQHEALLCSAHTEKSLAAAGDGEQQLLDYYLYLQHGMPGQALNKPGAQRQRWGPADAGGNALEAGNLPEALCMSQADAHFVSTDREVDIMLKVFQDMNTSMERTGEFGSTGAAGGTKAELLRMVASNNVMRTGILSSKIGLTKRWGPLCWLPASWECHSSE